MENFGQINMMYACITVLRALSMMDGPQQVWKDYTKFYSHLNERMKTEVYTKVRREQKAKIILRTWEQKPIIFAFTVGQQGEGRLFHPPLPEVDQQIQ